MRQQVRVLPGAPRSLRAISEARGDADEGGDGIGGAGHADIDPGIELPVVSDHIGQPAVQRDDVAIARAAELPDHLAIGAELVADRVGERGRSEERRVISRRPVRAGEIGCRIEPEAEAPTELDRKRDDEAKADLAVADTVRIVGRDGDVGQERERAVAWRCLLYTSPSPRDRG